jgi:Domain of unknown function (DUF4389)
VSDTTDDAIAPEPDLPPASAPTPTGPQDDAEVGAAAVESPREPHPIQLVVTDDLRRSRLTVLLRLPLSVPHLIWLYLWSIPVVFAVLAAWVIGLFLGRIPAPLHRFLAAFTRYNAHLTAYLTIAANPFPGFTGSLPYPVDLEIAPAAKQGRLGIFFRLLLAIPAMIVVYVLQLVLYTLAVVAWFAGLFTGNLNKALRDILTFCIRYMGQTNAYLFLLTKRYPTFKDT